MKLTYFKEKSLEKHLIYVTIEARKIWIEGLDCNDSIPYTKAIRCYKSVLKKCCMKKRIIRKKS